MIQLAWSRCRDRDCLRVRGLAPGVDVQVRPASGTLALGAPPMAGGLVADGDDLCFVPRFPFVDGTTYTISVGGVVEALLTRPRPERPATTEVLAIHPCATVVPRNLLRFYVRFSAPMREGSAAGRVRLVDELGEVIVGALLPAEHELWDPTRCRLTVLLDPARLKRGLVAHRELGYPLRRGRSFRLVVDPEYLDARGAPLVAGAERRYEVGGDERRHVEPALWALTAPRTGTMDPFEVRFDRPLDHGLLARCLHVVGPDRRAVRGPSEVGPEERSWRLAPREPWTPGAHELVVDPVLEDLAGNSLRRVFDRDLTRPEDEPRDLPEPVTVRFRPG
jgi:hypothetical protein